MQAAADVVIVEPNRVPFTRAVGAQGRINRRRDLLDRGDVDASAQCVQARIGESPEQTAPVHPMSSIDSQRQALQRSFAIQLQSQIESQIERAESLKTEWSERKLARLRHE